MVWPKRPLDSVLTGVDLYLPSPSKSNKDDLVTALKSDLLVAAHKPDVVILLL